MSTKLEEAKCPEGFALQVRDSAADKWVDCIGDLLKTEHAHMALSVETVERMSRGEYVRLQRDIGGGMWKEWEFRFQKLGPFPKYADCGCQLVKIKNGEFEIMHDILCRDEIRRRAEKFC